MFFWNSCFFNDPVDVGNLISGSSAFSKISWNIWKFTIPVLLKPGVENFEHYFTSMWDECNCAVVWAFFGIAFLLGLEWKLTFSSPVATAEFSKFAGILSAALSQHHLLRFERAPLNMSANLENSAVATGLEKVSFHSNPKERQCQRMFKLPHNCTHLTC